MIDSARLNTQWERDGYVRFPNFVSIETQRELRRICDRIYQQMVEEHPQYQDTTNVASLTEPRYFHDRSEEWVTLLDFIAHPTILSILHALADGVVLFHNTQYFCQPMHRSWDGIWHRDTQFQAQDVVEEQRRMACITGVHFRVAFEPDEQLEYVPGSHTRWDTDAEWAIRGGDRPTQPDMPHRQRICLQPGDACLFHGWGIHRGTYRCDRPRRTFDIIYGWGGLCDWAIPRPMGLNEGDRIQALRPEARSFYQHVVDTYQSYWVG